MSDDLTAVLPPIRCTPAQLAAWKKAANADDRPLAQWIRKALDREQINTLDDVYRRDLATRKRPK